MCTRPSMKVVRIVVLCVFSLFLDGSSACGLALIRSGFGFGAMAEVVVLFVYMCT